MTKRAMPDHSIQELLAARWSPYAFANRPVAPADLQALFEAARWAASSYNEQPWHYLVATQAEPEAFARLLSCLVEPNQVWAKAVPVLAVSVAHLTFALNGKPNKAAIHDLGLAAGNLTVEATARGLAVHQMIGILPDRVRELYQLPAGYEAVTALAIGYAGDPAQLPEKLRERDLAPRTRKPLKEFVFSGQWGQPWSAMATLLTVLAIPWMMGADMQTNGTIEIYHARTGRVERVQPVVKSDEAWRRLLTPEQYEVTRRRGTERPFSNACAIPPAGQGTYQCVGCGTDLFAYGNKFESGTGWPSFWNPVSPLNVRLEADVSHGMRRVEVVCARCGAHLGHLFDDGPPPTHKRYCINAVALVLAPTHTR